MKNLEKPLGELNDWLVENDLMLDLIVIGAFALHLHGLSARMTMDIDTIREIESDQVRNKINEIGDKYGVPYWLNDQEENLIIPDGFFDRVHQDDRFSNIKLSYASRIDLIFLKVVAYYYRHETELKDLDDLLVLNVSTRELESAKEFLKNSHRPDSIKFLDDFYSSVDKIVDDLEVKLYGE